jgi:hypothetical protein
MDNNDKIISFAIGGAIGCFSSIVIISLYFYINRPNLSGLF